VISSVLSTTPFLSFLSSLSSLHIASTFPDYSDVIPNKLYNMSFCAHFNRLDYLDSTFFHSEKVRQWFGAPQNMTKTDMDNTQIVSRPLTVLYCVNIIGGICSM
jgi:hypothetical protein